MVYELRAFITQDNVFAGFPRMNDFITVAPLNQGCWLMLSDWHLRDVLAQTPDEDLPEYDNVLGQAELDLVMELSQDRLIAYIQADFVNGHGYQRAFVWEQGALVLRPATNGKLGTVPGANGPINAALRHIGVVANHPYDEFDSVGLGKHHQMEDWFVAYTSHTNFDDYMSG